MSGKELYEKYKGCRISYSSCEGIVAGYGIGSYDRKLIMLIDASYDRGWRIHAGRLENGVIMIGHHDLNQYYWVDEANVVKPPEFLDPKAYAESWINGIVPNASVELKDIYISIFIEGTKYKKDEARTNII